MKNLPKADGFFIRHATAVAIASVTLLMVLCSTVFYFQGKASNNAKVWVVHTYDVTGHIQLLFNRLKDVELGQRGYMIAGDEKYLAPYHDALKDSLGEDARSTQLQQHHSIGEELTILRKITSDSSVQQKNLDEMAGDVKELLNYWAATIQMRHTQGKDILLKFNFDHGNKLMDRIHSLVNIMMAEENNLLSLRIKNDESSTRLNNILSFSGIAIFYAVMLMAIWFYHTRKREANSTQQQLIKRLAESNTELERFAYVASHDMQEPIRMVTNFSELIAEEYGEKLDEEGREYIKLITESSQRMQEMIMDLLEYARIGNDSTRFMIIDGTKELKHVLENLATAIAEHEAQITYEPLPKFKCNPVQFLRLLQNLISNGLKYQQQDVIPRIHIGVEDRIDSWCFSIRDNGIGIEKEYLNKIFEPFKRLHTWAQYKGTGIGLAICRKIVENHGGNIWATSELGKGSVFYFTMPKMNGGGLMTAALYKGRPAEILHVEDNYGDVLLTKMAFKKSKIANHITVAKDGEEAMLILHCEGQYANAPAPDLILLDLNLPKKSGKEVLQEIKSDNKLKHIPVVILTSSHVDIDIVKDYNLPPNSFIIKPSSMEKFAETVAMIEQYWLSIATVPEKKIEKDI